MLKKHIPLNYRLLIPKSIKRKAGDIWPRLKWIGNERIFCISLQKTGTTSVGDFFFEHGFPTARYSSNKRNRWDQLWLNGNYEAIFGSADFKKFQVFEDDPWWYPEFYKLLYHRFPGSRFVFFTRDVDAWFNSMMNHSKGQSLGNTRLHAKLYRREIEFFDRMDNDPAFVPGKHKDKLLRLAEEADMYKALYALRTREVTEFFRDHHPERFIHLELEDPEKWKKLARFMGMNIEPSYEAHANSTAARENQSMTSR